MTSIDPVTPNTYPVYPEPPEEPVQEEEIPPKERDGRGEEAPPPEDRPYESWDDDRGKHVDISG